MSDSGQGALRLLLGAWYLAGLVLLIDLLAKGDVETLATRIGSAAFAILVLGYVVVAGVRLAEREGWAGLVGAATVLIAIATLLLVVVEIWSDDPLRQLTRTMAMVFISLLLGMISLLLDGERTEDADAVRLARAVGSLALVVLGVLAVLGACNVEMSPRIPALASALFIVPVVSLPALRLLDSED
ncbi:MAG TPA: hypothetical protein VNN15_06645 [Solirubrobacterales bacterium]|nr:hypothetical protein [Solirubrobacterales bacterium]